MLPAIALLVATIAADEASPIAVVVRDMQGVTSTQAQPFADALARAIERTTQRTTFADNMLWACPAADECLNDLRQRTGASDVLILDLAAATTRLRVVAERLDRDGVPERRVLIDLPRDPGLAKMEHDSFAALLFPTASITGARIATHAPAEASESIKPIVGFGMLAAGAIAGGLGVLFRVRSNDARDRAESLPVGAEFDDARTSARSQITASNVLFVGAAALLAAGIVLELD